jgi:hypothetical protein
MDRRDLLPALLLALFAVAVHTVWSFREGLVLAGTLPDTDSYARLIRVRELWAGAGWTNPVTPSLNAPEGLFLHWTRPLDVLILGPAWLLHAAGLPRDAAIYWSGAAICPLLHLCVALVAVWAARALWSRSASWLAGLFVVIAPALFSYSMFGRADHHTLIALFGALIIGFGLHALRGRRKGLLAIGCGVSGGAGLWVSPETILFLAPMLAGFGAAWVTGPDPRSAALQGLRASLAAMLTVAAAILAERGAGEAFFVAYDVISLPHLALCAATAVVFAAAAGAAAAPWPGRIAVGAVTGGATLWGLLAAFPGLPSAAMSDAGTVTTELFLPAVIELQPFSLATAEAAQRSLGLLGGAPIVALLVLLLAAGPWLGGRRIVLIAPLLLLLAVNGYATLRHIRFTADLALPAAILAAGLPQVLQRRLGAWPTTPLILLRTGLLLGIALFPALAILAFPLGDGPRAEPAGRECDATALARWLAAERAGLAPGERPILFADQINMGPALAWGGGVRVVGGPYHRGESAFADTVALFHAPTAEAARDVVERREAAFVMVCRSLSLDDRRGTFAKRLLEGDLPDWLSPVTLPAPLAEHIILLRVAR